MKTPSYWRSTGSFLAGRSPHDRPGEQHADSKNSHRFGHTELPDEQGKALRKAVKFEWITLGFLTLSTVLVFLVLGNSQAMKAAWIEDLLSFLPPIAFLVATRVIRRRPSAEHPYGFHRSVGIAHLVAAVALVVMGAYLIVDSGMGLLSAEHPTIGAIELFGQTFWLGWLMIAAMILTAAPPVYLGRIKMKLAGKLHDKVLYADADMNKADWMTALAAAVGVAGIGVGLWWADSAARHLRKHPARRRQEPPRRRRRPDGRARTDLRRRRSRPDHRRHRPVPAGAGLGGGSSLPDQGRRPRLPH